MLAVSTLFFLLALPAVTATAIACEILHRRGKRPSVWVAVASAFFMTPPAIIVPVAGQVDGKALTWRQFWEGGAKPGAAEILLPIIGLSVIGALLLSAVVVWFYERKTGAIRR